MTTTPVTTPQLSRYQAEFSQVPGFFSYESMVVWDFLFNAQSRRRIVGDFLEIGVYRGKSAALGALYLRPQERAVFVDIKFTAETRDVIERARPSDNLFLERRSGDLLGDPALRDGVGRFRWCHIDGDHTGYSTAEDLHTCAHLVGERGLICVDDFFNFKYPQLTAAVYDFLIANPLRFRMLFCGFNKCYICRASEYAAYEKDIRENLFGHLREHGLKAQLCKTSYSFDSGCFSVHPHSSPAGHDIYGMDHDPTFVPA